MKSYHDDPVINARVLVARADVIAHGREGQDFNTAIFVADIGDELLEDVVEYLWGVKYVVNVEALDEKKPTSHPVVVLLIEYSDKMDVFDVKRAIARAARHDYPEAPDHNRIKHINA